MDGAHESDPTGLYGYNCRHRHYVWFEGASSLPKEQAEPKPVTIDGKTYDYYAMTQKMRAMERNIRALKREKEAEEALGNDTRELQVKIKEKTAKYKEFCKMCGVPEETSRLRYECGMADLKKTKAWDSYAMQLKGMESGINKPNKDLIRIPQIPASTIIQKIRSGEYSTKLSIQQYDKHCKGTTKYNEYLQSRQNKGGNPQSIISVSAEMAQKIIETKAGTGIIKVDRLGNPRPQEQVTCDFVVGKYYFRGEYIDTKKCTIHYGKKGSHIVPERGENYD